MFPFKKNEGPKAALIAPAGDMRGASLRTFWQTHKRGCILAVCAVVLAVIFVPRMLGGKAEPVSSEIEQPLERRDISNVFTGSGTIAAADSYTVKSLVSGTVLTADFELGDPVEKGTVLYTIDSTESAGDAASAEMSLEQAQRAYAAASDAGSVRAGINGTVGAYYVAAGDAVQMGQELAVLRDSSTMLLAVPFPAAEAEGFAAGQEAAVTLDATFETLRGAVRSVSGVNVGGDGSLLTRTVTIAVPNAGGLTTTQAATASVGGVSALESAHFICLREQVITAPADGTVSTLCVAEGSAVKQDDVLLRIESRALTQQIKDAADNVASAELAVEAAARKLSHYTITSPIAGTIVDKKVKAGDVLGGAASTGAETLCTIYDMSYLELVLDVDELKVRALKEGQTVTITAEAVPGEEYTGVITSVLIAGTTINGTTTYPVTVRIDDPGELRPGMNVNASITTASAKRALALPSVALVRGGYVLVTADSPSAANAVADMEAPAGYVYVPVKMGISDSDYIEVTGGLTDGDIVAYDPSNVAATDETAGE